jgi:hypothetical protein
VSGPVTSVCIDPAKRKHRFYKMFIAPSLSAEWMLIREWDGLAAPAACAATGTTIPA